MNLSNGAKTPNGPSSAKVLNFEQKSKKAYLDGTGPLTNPNKKAPIKRNTVSRSWCFTINNYTDHDVKSLRRIGEGFKYIVLGFEKGPSGTPHIQGYCLLNSARRFKAMRIILGGKRVHLESAIGTPSQAALYCKKDGSFWEAGTPPRGKGARSDLLEVCDAIKSDCLQEKDVALKYSRQFVRYHSGLSKLSALVASSASALALKKSVAGLALRPWQKVFINHLHTLYLEDDDRKILWCVDPKGGQGKSTLARYLFAHFGAQLLQSSGHNHMAYAFDVSSKLVVIDIPMSGSEFIPYGFIENVRDGRVFSTKYNSCMKMKPPGRDTIVCVFSNLMPDLTKFASDRWLLFTDFDQSDPDGLFARPSTSFEGWPSLTQREFEVVDLLSGPDDSEEEAEEDAKEAKFLYKDEVDRSLSLLCFEDFDDENSELCAPTQPLTPVDENEFSDSENEEMCDGS